MPPTPEPTDRELEILKVLWDLGEGSVHQVWLGLRDRIPIVQNTVQAFLRTMEQKGLVAHRARGRTFFYRPLVAREQTARGLLRALLHRAFDGALDELVEHALALRPPTHEELERLRRLLAEVEADRRRRGRRKP